MYVFSYTSDIGAVNSIEIKIKEGETFEEVIQAFVAFSIAVGYHQHTIADWLAEDAADYLGLDARKDPTNED